MTGRSWTPPTLTDIVVYCNQNNLNVDAEKFYRYYSKSGFMYKGLPMDWQKKLTEWDKTEIRKSGDVKPEPVENDPNRVKRYGSPDDWKAYLKKMRKMLDNNMI